MKIQFKCVLILFPAPNIIGLQVLFFYMPLGHIYMPFYYMTTQGLYNICTYMAGMSLMRYDS